MERGQFTFYRSFWDAVRGLPKRDRLPILEAIIGYALDENEPVGLSQRQAAFFALVRPNLDTSRRKAANGKSGGSKTKAKHKQNESKAEVEIDTEKEFNNEIDFKKELQTDMCLGVGVEQIDFEDFWEEYPCKIGYQKARDVWQGIDPSAQLVKEMMEGLQRWKKSYRWRKEDGRYIPKAAKWLSEKYWLTPPGQEKEEIPKGATGVLGAAEIEAIERIMSQ